MSVKERLGNKVVVVLCLLNNPTSNFIFKLFIRLERKGKDKNADSKLYNSAREPSQLPGNQP